MTRKRTELPARFPCEPFIAWLNVYTEDCFGDVSFEIGISERMIREIKAHGRKTVSFDVVDTALQRARRIIELDGVPIYWLDDLYPEFFVHERTAA